MTRFRYRGDRERIYLGPPVRVMSPGDIVDLTTNPDPTLFEAVPDSGPADHRPSDPDPVDAGGRDRGSGDDDGPADAGGSGPAEVHDGDAAPGRGGEPR